MGFLGGQGAREPHGPVKKEATEGHTTLHTCTSLYTWAATLRQSVEGRVGGRAKINFMRFFDLWSLH